MKIPETLLQDFRRFVEMRTGLSLPPLAGSGLSRGMLALARELRWNDIEAGMRACMAAPHTPDLVGMLARHFTTGETYFFRDPAVFNALEYEVLPRLIGQRRAGSKHLRIWSAGCCTGEEPYSVAILLSRLIPDLKDWRITVLATDINPAFLDKARRGVYRDWSFRNAPASLKSSHFTMADAESYAISESIRRLVTFGYLNLAEDTYPSAAGNTVDMDIVLCRNVLMYFDAARAMQVIERLHRTLAEGGLLIVSPAESSQEMFPQFTGVHFPGAMFYRKATAKTNVSALSADTCEKVGRAQEMPGRKISVAPAAVSRKEDMRSNEEVPQSLALLARSHADLGQLDEALRFCEAAITSDKSNPELRYLRAMIFKEQNRMDAAAQSLKQALFLDHGFVLAHFALGSLYRRSGKTIEAARYFSNAAALLGKYAPGDTLPESGGMTAARLSEIIRATGGVK